MTQKTVVLIILAISILFNLFFIVRSCNDGENSAIYDPMKDPEVISLLKQDSIAQEKLKQELATLERENEAIDTEREELKKQFEKSSNNITVRNQIKKQNINKIKEMDELELEKDINRKLLAIRHKFD